MRELGKREASTTWESRSLKLARALVNKLGLSTVSDADLLATLGWIVMP
jgi:hypothetical protein